MPKYNLDLDYLIANIDITKQELQDIIAQADSIISQNNIDNETKAQAYLKKAQSLQKLEKIIESKEPIEKLLDLYPDMSEGLLRLAVVYDEEGEHDKAIDIFNKIIKLNPDNVIVYNNRGIAYSEKKAYDKAIEDYTKAIELNPDYVNAYYNRGNAYSDKKEYDKAIEEYTKAIELKPDYVNAYYNRGNAYYYKKEYDKAIEEYTKAIELDSNCIYAYNNRGFAYDKIKEYENAFKDFLQVLKLDPNQKHLKNKILEYSDIIWKIDTDILWKYNIKQLEYLPYFFVNLIVFCKMHKYTEDCHRDLIHNVPLSSKIIDIEKA